ncbi:MAG: sigma-70 family RNA polymerase sigma factor [Dehalococcoidia bacterium]|nr:sigma-70 family RNA polymerase sigma factor [Dehalococcoidia bacterium]
MFRIAHNQVIDSGRRQTRRPTVPLDEAPEMPGKDGDFAQRTVEGVWIRQALAHLTQLQQTIVGLRFGSDLSIEETAKVLGKSQGAVKAAQHAAIGALRKLMEEPQRPGEAGSRGEGRM